MRYVALLRGINVGGNRKIPMAELREALTQAGFSDVTTHLQSGNALISTDDNGDDAARRVEEAIEERFGMRVAVLTRTAADLKAIIDGNPLSHGLQNPSRFNVTFLSSQPSPESLSRIGDQAFGPEE